jgi:hypothetical protein
VMVTLACFDTCFVLFTLTLSPHIYISKVETHPLYLTLVDAKYENEAMDSFLTVRVLRTGEVKACIYI